MVLSPSLCQIPFIDVIIYYVVYNSIWRFCISVKYATDNLIPMTIEDDLRRCYETVGMTIVMLSKLFGL